MVFVNLFLQLLLLKKGRGKSGIQLRHQSPAVIIRTDKLLAQPMQRGLGEPHTEQDKQQPHAACCGKNHIHVDKGLACILKQDILGKAYG